jgi:surfactin synthase thioesterase subunit
MPLAQRPAAPQRAFRTPLPRPEATVRLVCLPFAGGSASLYRAWPNGLPSAVEVVTVELPGHGARLHEPLAPDLPALVDDLGGDLPALVDRPLAIFGYSMGALVGFELAQRMRAHDVVPFAFFAASSVAPPSYPEGVPVSDLPDDELRAVLSANGSAVEILRDDELVRLFLPLVRADLRLVERASFPPRAGLGCPVRVYVGSEDPFVGGAGLDGWAGESSGDFRVRRFPGGHFFVQECEELVLHHLTRDLEALGLRD